MTSAQDKGITMLCIIMQVFRRTHIPRRLDEVEDHEADFERLAGAGLSGVNFLDLDPNDRQIMT